MGEADRARGAPHAAVLWVLLAAFCFRVGAQLVQAWRPVSWLPSFEHWQSGALPYPLLVGAQVAIIALYAMIARRIADPGRGPSRKLGRWLLGFGIVYFALMTVRLALGLSLLDGHPWWDRPLPSVFHLVLAGFLLVAGDAHVRGFGGEETSAGET